MTPAAATDNATSTNKKREIPSNYQRNHGLGCADHSILNLGLSLHLYVNKQQNL